MGRYDGNSVLLLWKLSSFSCALLCFILPFPSLLPSSFCASSHLPVISHFSQVRLCETLWTVARQAPLTMEFSRQEYWSGLPCPSPGDLPNPGIKSASLTSLALTFFTTSATWLGPSSIHLFVLQPPTIHLPNSQPALPCTEGNLHLLLGKLSLPRTFLR